MPSSRATESPIGGYFELEIPAGKGTPLGNAVGLNTGRNALLYILKLLPNVRHVHLPIYTCPSILDPIRRLGMAFSFYEIDRDLIPVLPKQISSNSALLLVNYFGVCDESIRRITCRGTSHVIVDASQAFFFAAPPGVPVFNSARKFFGVPDGSFVQNVTDKTTELDYDVSFGRCNHLLKRLDIDAESGYADFIQNESSLSVVPLRKMSRLSEAILRSIDMPDVATARRQNFKELDDELKSINRLSFGLAEDAVPMVYPLWIHRGRELRQFLLRKQVYCARYWPELPTEVPPESNEAMLSHDMVPLPIDQRYTHSHMIRILSAVSHWRSTQ